jgi:hypothetical protein
MTALQAASHTGEIRVMSTLGPIRTGDRLLRKQVRYPAAPRGYKCARKESNLQRRGDGVTARRAHHTAQLAHGSMTGLEPASAWPTTRPLGLFGIMLSAPCRTRTCGLPGVGRLLSLLS